MFKSMPLIKSSDQHQFDHDTLQVLGRDGFPLAINSYNLQNLIQILQHEGSRAVDEERQPIKMTNKN